MSLLEDARQLADGPYPADDQGYCRLCDGPNYLGDHKPDCPVLALPKMVAVLEAAERMAQGDGPLYNRYQGGINYQSTCMFCGDIDGEHYAACEWKALVAALKDTP